MTMMKDAPEPGECPAQDCPGTLTSEDTVTTGMNDEPLTGYEIVCSSDPMHNEEHLG